jgi:hypothetical protein
MTTEFDRYAIERIMRGYSNDLLSAFHSAMPIDDATKRNAIARAQSMLADIAYLNKIADGIKEQIAECQRRL